MHGPLASRRRPRLAKALTPILLALCAPAASAELLYLNGFPDEYDAYSRSISSARTADDFALEVPVQVDSIRFWMVANPGHFIGTLSYAVYANAGGALGSVVESGSVSDAAAVLVNDIPVHVAAMYRVDFDLPEPLALHAGTYWLELHNGPQLTADLSTAVLWAVVADASGNAKQSPAPNPPAANTGEALAFALYGTVPEPGALAGGMLALGSVGVLSRARGRASWSRSPRARDSRT